MHRYAHSSAQQVTVILPPPNETYALQGGFSVNWKLPTSGTFLFSFRENCKRSHPSKAPTTSNIGSALRLGPHCCTVDQDNSPRSTEGLRTRCFCALLSFFLLPSDSRGSGHSSTGDDGARAMRALTREAGGRPSRKGPARQRRGKAKTRCIFCNPLRSPALDVVFYGLGVSKYRIAAVMASNVFCGASSQIASVGCTDPAHVSPTCLFSTVAHLLPVTRQNSWECGRKQVSKTFKRGRDLQCTESQNFSRQGLVDASSKRMSLVTIKVPVSPFRSRFPAPEEAYQVNIWPRTRR